MNVDHLHRHLPSQNTERGRNIAKGMLVGQQLNGEKQAEAIEQLATVPEGWLQRIDDVHMGYVALAYGEDLTDTKLFPTYTPEKLAEQAQTAKPLLGEVEAQVDAGIQKDMSETDDAFASAMIERSKPETMAEALSEKLQSVGLGFAVRVVRDTLPVSFLEGEYTIEEDESALFRKLLFDINGPGLAEGVQSSDDLQDMTLVKPDSGVVVVPFKSNKGKMMSPVAEESWSSISGASMDQHGGAHYWEAGLIVVDDDVVPMPSQKTGLHSVLLHETGHAIDYLAEEIEELNHRETIDGMFASDTKRAREGDVRFLTGRATDNAREYFAEAVEAYLTTDPGRGGNAYKQENNHAQLKATNPELFTYVDKLMKLPGPDSPKE